MEEAKVNDDTEFYRIKGGVGVPPLPIINNFSKSLQNFMSPAPSITKFSYLTLFDMGGA